MTPQDVATINAILDDANTLIADRLRAAGIRIPYAVSGIDETGAIYVRANCDGEMLVEIADAVRNVATGKAPQAPPKPH